MSRLVPLALAITAVAFLAGCTTIEPLPTPTPTPTATESFAPTGDGVLRIGTLFAMTGDVSAIGPAMVAAVEVAVRDINAAGGVLGQPVEVFSRNSGDASEQLLESSFAALVDRDVDVVIGPATPALTERLLPLAQAVGVTVITPAAIFPSSSAADPQGVLFRTIPSYDQQAGAIVRSLAADGAESVAVITDGDAPGLAFGVAVRAALDRYDMQLTSINQLDARTTVARLAFSVTAAEPDAVIVATGAAVSERTPGVLAALLSRGVAPEQVWLTSNNLADYSATLETAALEGANGVGGSSVVSDELIARLVQSDPALRSFRYAPETYDAVVIAALAAVLADDDSGASIARMLPLTATAGVPCASFGECIDVLTTEPAIDYDGLSGPLAFDAVGDLLAGEVGLYRYTAQNVAERIGSLSIADD